VRALLDFVFDCASTRRSGCEQDRASEVLEFDNILVRDLVDPKRVSRLFVLSFNAAQHTHIVRLKASAIKSLFPHLTAKSLRATINAKGRGWLLFKKELIGRRLGPVDMNVWFSPDGSKRKLSVFTSVNPRSSLSPQLVFVNQQS